MGAAKLDEYKTGARAVNLYVDGRVEFFAQRLKTYQHLKGEEGQAFWLAVASQPKTPTKLLRLAAKFGGLAARKKVVSHPNVDIETVMALIQKKELHDSLMVDFIYGHVSNELKAKVLKGLESREVHKLVTLCRPHTASCLSDVRERFIFRFRASVAQIDIIDGIIYHLSLEKEVPEQDVLTECFSVLAERQDDRRSLNLFRKIYKRGSFIGITERLAESDLEETKAAARQYLLKIRPAKAGS